jgi:CDP-diacylglycerol pyrophosphatase
MLFVSRTRSLAAALLAAVALGAFTSAPSAQTFACPKTPVERVRWYSPVSSNLADKAAAQCDACHEPANASDESCAVYRTLQSEECRDGQCADEQGEFWLNWQAGYALQQSLRYQHPFKYILDAGSNCWFLIWALEPVIGVEHAGARDAVNFWRAGFMAATHAVSPPIPEHELGLVIQPAHRRSQHQLHIHIGRLEPDYRTAIDGLEPIAGLVQPIHLNGHQFFIQYLPDLPGKSPLEGYQVFDEVAAMIPGGEASMPRFGVLVARAEDGAGSWVMAAEGLTRRELDFSYDQACTLDSRAIPYSP